MEIVFLELFENSDSSILATSPSSLVIFSFKFQCFLRISESLNSTFHPGPFPQCEAPVSEVLDIQLDDLSHTPALH